MGALVAWIGFATLLLGATAAMLTQSIGLLAVSAYIWLVLLVFNCVSGISPIFYSRNRSFRLQWLTFVTNDRWQPKPERHSVI